MRQRNVSGSPLYAPDIPALVLPGDAIDWDEPLAGFEPVPESKPVTGDRSSKPAAEPGKEAGK